MKSYVCSKTFKKYFELQSQNSDYIYIYLQILAKSNVYIFYRPKISFFILKYGYFVFIERTYYTVKNNIPQKFF